MVGNVGGVVKDGILLDRACEENEIEAGSAAEEDEAARGSRGERQEEGR